MQALILAMSFASAVPLNPMLSTNAYSRDKALLNMTSGSSTARSLSEIARAALAMHEGYGRSKRITTFSVIAFLI
jgi:hypothetical protein